MKNNPTPTEAEEQATLVEDNGTTTSAGWIEHEKFWPLPRLPATRATESRAYPLPINRNIKKLTMNHASLFSGIGGFDLAAEWSGLENIFQVEKDNYCLKVLEKNFPNTKRYNDIKQFDGSEYAGRVDILTGGFPCQPFSAAGKRKGTEDDRFLWPEMLRVVRTVKPTWIIAENVRGLLTIEQGMVFEQVCLDLESAGYEVQPIIIPACALNAPHRRDRVWFLAHANNSSTRNGPGQVGETDCVQSEVGQKVCSREFSGANENVTDAHNGRQTEQKQQTTRNKQFNYHASYSNGKGLERWKSDKPQGQCSQSDRGWSNKGPDWSENWIAVATKLCSLPDGLPVTLDGFKLSPSGHRREQLKGYGNAIVPQIAYQIFKSII